MKKIHFLLNLILAFTLCGCATGAGCSVTPSSRKDLQAAKRTYEYLSPVYHVDRIYKSMQGPISTETVRLGEAQDTGLLWITGMRVQMVDADGATPVSNDFMCHTNLDFDLKQRALKSSNAAHAFARIVTLSQGQYALDLPKGFGIPLKANEPLLLSTQVLNLNIARPDKNIRHKVSIDYVRDADLKKPMLPLYTTAAQILVPFKGGMATHAADCALGQDISQWSERTGHWVLKPGKEINTTAVTEDLNLTFDTTVHYIEVHLHPYAESLVLRDRTDGRELFKARAHNRPDRLGLARVASFSSVKGIPVYKDHEYELISTYKNTSAEDSDAMAHMVLFLRDKEFQR